MRGAGLLLVSTLLFSAGCGKKGPLIYPDMLIAQPPRNLILMQSGLSLRISFDLPDKDLSGRKLDDLEALLIARRVYSGSTSVSCQDPFIDLYRINLAGPSAADRQGNHISWVDTDTRKGERYQYQLKTIQKGEMNGKAVSTAIAAVFTPPFPPVLKVHSIFGGAIRIDLSGASQADTSFVSYLLYRSEGGSGQPQLLAVLPTGSSSYEDQAVQRGTVYHYVARMSVKRPDGIVAESELSAPVLVSVADDPQ
jgi:hypothetical protein